MGIDNIANASLPGPSQAEPYQTGVDYGGLAPVSGFPSDMNMGVAGGNTGDSVPDSFFSSNSTDSFNDVPDGHPADGGGHDAMRRLAGQPTVEVLEQEQVYAVQGPLPFPFPLPETSQPLLNADRTDE